MKIGVVTFWQTRDNYGQILQCWALQQFLKEIGHAPFLIRYAHTEHRISLQEKIYHFIRNIIRFQFSSLFIQQKCLGNPTETEKLRNFEDFKDKFLEKSDKVYYSYAELLNDVPKADCYIVGSDQVWGRSLVTNDGMIFMLNFVPKGKMKLSYAASFGSPMKNHFYIKLLAKYLKSFNYVSVREKTGVNICSKANINSVLVLDPTLLLFSNIYIHSFALNTKKKESNIYIFFKY